MLGRLSTLASGVRLRAAIRHWENEAGSAEFLNLSDLRELRVRARRLRRRLDRILHVADARLTLPVLGSDAMRRPAQSDWSYRPELWAGPVVPSGVASAPTKTRLGVETTLFHDCDISEMTLRQVRNTREEDLAPFGLTMDVFNFDGSFLSLVVEMPTTALEGLRKSHLLRLNMIVESEKPLEIFARLNVKHGPNTEQIVRELDLADRDIVVEFDMAYTKFNDKRSERMWIDLIFEGPSMNKISLRDVTLSRRPRADV